MNVQPTATPAQEPPAHFNDCGFAWLDFQIDDCPGPVRTALFGSQHLLVMFTAKVGRPLIVMGILLAMVLNLGFPKEDEVCVVPQPLPN